MNGVYNDTCLAPSDDDTISDVNAAHILAEFPPKALWGFRFQGDRDSPAFCARIAMRFSFEEGGVFLWSEIIIVNSIAGNSEEMTYVDFQNTGRHLNHAIQIYPLKHEYFEAPVLRFDPLELPDA